MPPHLHDDTRATRHVLQQLPASLEGLCLDQTCVYALPEVLHVLSGLTRSDRLEVGDPLFANGSRCLDESTPWCERLIGLRQLGLVEAPTGASNVRLIARYLTALGTCGCCCCTSTASRTYPA